eukprot:CAMPEP_0177330282 /NCGR_PEP_ID=MMETSP0368-20130122/20434_1 /TAXON_ID=447022 ORGANISM="Scrippsiella hangoei-like, Strain SHHI-4" /NCGR_SAMPLE_ID=MMETSP0368 /ASSEMBLY_ACC=CAM_ASM_000363 /LENGTH=252 /DNA_ID=CAMNT_0018790587 /DNA_START=60 /DNA_END=815 /DNA_ORIENTATION=-
MVSFIYILLLLGVVCTIAVPAEDNSTCTPGSVCDGDSAGEDSALLQLRGKDSSAGKEELHEKDSSVDTEEVLAWAPAARAATAALARTAHAKMAASVAVAPGTALVVTVHPTTMIAAAAHPRAPADAATAAAAAMALARVAATVAADTRMAPNVPAAHLITTIAAAARPRAPACAATAAAAAMALARVVAMVAAETGMAPNALGRCGLQQCSHDHCSLRESKLCRPALVTALVNRLMLQVVRSSGCVRLCQA